MATSDELRNQLQDLRQLLNDIPEVSEPPKSTFRILGAATSEHHWNLFLAYFLDPSQPHGFDTELLQTFLDTAQRETELEVAYYHGQLTKAEVDTEVSSPDDNRPDIVIRVPEEWFVCIESKVEASEGERQTPRYAEDPYLGNEDKNQYPDEGQEYLFIYRENAPNSRSKDFADLYWSSIVEAFNDHLQQSHGRYPKRSVNQLEEFLSTITEGIHMGDDKFVEEQKQKVQLLAKYKDEFDELVEATNKLRERAIEDWPNQFRTHVNEDLWTDEWHARGGKWGILYRDGWYLDGDLNPTTDVDETRGNDGIRLHFMHYIRDEDSFLEGKLKFELVCNTSVPVREQFYQLYIDEDWQRELRSRLDEQYLVNNKSTFTRRVYDVDQSELPESYFETLAIAFEDHLPIVETVDNILSEAVENTKQR